MQLLCGQCGQALQVDDVLAGGTFPCPHCKHEIPVPDFGAAESSAPAAPMTAAAPLPDDDGGGFADVARKSMSRRTRLACGKCGKGFSVGVRFAGKKAKCPSCGTKILIPFPDEDHEKELDSLLDIDEEQLATEEQVEIYETDQDEAPIDLSTYVPSSPQPRKRRSRRHGVRERSPVVAALVVMGLIAAVGVAVVFAIPRSRAWIMAALGSPPGPDVENAAANAGAARNAASVSNAPTVAVAPPKMKVDSIRAELFACDGYFPAPPGQVYAKVTLTVTAGGDKFMLVTDSPALQDGDRSFPSLGVAGAKSVVPVRSVKQPCFIDVGASQTITLLFLVPANLARAKLSVRPMETQVDLPAAPKDLPAEAVVGTYVEKPPRNLKPVMRDPVMSALQTTPNQILEILRDKDGFALSVPGAGVSGSLKQAGTGMYQAQLNLQQQSLQCKFRLADDGKLLILYLTDEPFYQMTYQRK